MAKPWTYYASGANDEGEVWGFASVDQPFGIDIAKCMRVKRGSARKHGLCVQAALNLKCWDDHPDAKIFVDSGAFSEVDKNLRTVKPITDAEWKKRLEAMLALADAYGKDALIVAPDKVADQIETLRRLARYKKQLREIASTGAEVAVAVQRGAMSRAEFARAAREASGLSTVVYGIPMAKAPATIKEIVQFVKEVKPKRVHFLGIGPKGRGNKKIGLPSAAVLRRSMAQFPGVEFSWDSALIQAAVGKQGKVRPLTKAVAVERHDVGAEAVSGEVRWPHLAKYEPYGGALYDPFGTGVVLDWTEVPDQLNSWLPKIWKQQAKEALTAKRAATKTPGVKQKPITKRDREREYKAAQDRMAAAVVPSSSRASAAQVKRDRASFLKDPHGYFHARDSEGVERWESEPYVEMAIQDAWQLHVPSETVQLRKMRSIRRMFKRGPEFDPGALYPADAGPDYPRDSEDPSDSSEAQSILPGFE